MYCSRCGTQFPDQSKFCPSCGLEVGGAATTPVKAIAAGEMTEMDMVRDALASEYEISEELGRGGMAIVFRAKETELDRDVAIKVLPDLSAADADSVAAAVEKILSFRSFFSRKRPILMGFKRETSLAGCTPICRKTCARGLPR